MNINDRILFEQHFYNHGERKISNKELENVINIILNSKELTDSPIKLDQKKTVGTLLRLNCKLINTKKQNIEFEAYYCVTNGQTTENRVMEGTMETYKGELTISSKITRYSEKTHSFYLSELFSVQGYNYYRFSIYPNKCYRDFISFHDFDKYKKFEEMTLKRIKR